MSHTKSLSFTQGSRRKSRSLPLCPGEMPRIVPEWLISRPHSGMADGLTVNPEVTAGPGACSGHPVYLGSVPFPTVARTPFSVPIPPTPSQALCPVIYRILSYEPNSAPSSPQTEMPPNFPLLGPLVLGSSYPVGKEGGSF